MTPISAEEAVHQPIVTDGEIETRVSDLIGRAARRQLWLLFLNEDAVQLPVLIPMEDYPISPCDHAAVLAARIKEVMVATEAAQVVFVWERRIGEASTPADRGWAKALAAACEEEGVGVRAQLISHRKGVRWFPQDEYR